MLIMKARWQELEQCEDFEELKKACTDKDLDYLEEELEEFLNSTDDEMEEDNYPAIACWYNGMWSTEDLLECLECN